MIPKNTALVVKRVAATAHGPGLLARLAANTPLSKAHMYSIVPNSLFLAHSGSHSSSHRHRLRYSPDSDRGRIDLLRIRYVDIGSV